MLAREGAQVSARTALWSRGGRGMVMGVRDAYGIGKADAHDPAFRLAARRAAPHSAANPHPLARTSVATIFFINGPNANLYGLDPSGTYGSESFPQLQARCEAHAATLGVTLDFRQSNHEGVMVDWIQEAREKADAIVINAAGLTYTSIAILDALLAFEGPIIETHMSNIYKREPFRHHSYVSKAASGIVAGLGALGYELAISAAASLAAQRAKG